jgi:hypothetical protein
MTITQAREALERAAVKYERRVDAINEVNGPLQEYEWETAREGLCFAAESYARTLKANTEEAA